MTTVSEIRQILKELLDFTHKVTVEDFPASIACNEKLCYFAFREYVFERSYIFDQALKNGWLKYDNDTSKVIGAYLYL